MTHENYDREHHIDGPSDRSFGLVFAGAFLLVALLPMLRREPFRWWAVLVSAMLAATAFLRPGLLSVFNRNWTKLGVLIGKIVSPVALAILFYSFVTPVGLLMRIRGRDPLCLRFDRHAQSYWIRREPPGPPPDSMRNQF
jgi:Saxitoxin biosynthesis operon protein SxtJ